MRRLTAGGIVCFAQGMNAAFAGPDDIYTVRTQAPGPAGRLPLTEEMLKDRPSGDLFGWSQNAGMGWNPAELGRRQFLILSTMGGLRAESGR